MATDTVVGAGEVVEVGSAVAVEVEGSAVEAEAADGGSVAVVAEEEALVMVIGSGKRRLHIRIYACRGCCTDYSQWFNIVYNVLLSIVYIVNNANQTIQITINCFFCGQSVLWQF